MNGFSQRSWFRLDSVITSAGCVAAVSLLLSGCAQSQNGGRFASWEGFPRAEVPSILTGPVSVLLTNAAGFSAHVTVMQNPATRTNVPARSGNLVAQQGHLFWAPNDLNSRSSKGADLNLSYIWNVSDNSGYVISDALQGYAPVNFSLRYTNLLVTPSPENSPAEKLEGHRCALEQITVFSSDGTAHRFKTWRAADLNGLPLKIVSADDDNGTTVLLSQVRPERPPADAFEAPNGFTRYESAEAMVNELMRRGRGIKGSTEGQSFQGAPSSYRGRRPGSSSQKAE
ncbi:MAG: hypothetical protein ABI651_19055 [Verrucomicrobiota bacterium]